jgi:hypothetical protein
MSPLVKFIIMALFSNSKAGKSWTIIKSADGHCACACSDGRKKVFNEDWLYDLEQSGLITVLDEAAMTFKFNGSESVDYDAFVNAGSAVLAE